jgi:hypothetical protein
MKTIEVLQNREFLRALEEVDREIAADVREVGCRHCEGTLHRADYPRKPRNVGDDEADGGVGAHVRRFSFCCAREGCRKRHTPPSVRFLGRKVYLGAVVLLVGVLRHGLSSGRWRRLQAMLPIDRRTLQRWCDFWSTHFIRTPFWKVARALFMPPIEESRMPQMLFERFVPEGALSLRLLLCLRFLVGVNGRDRPA